MLFYYLLHGSVDAHADWSLILRLKRVLIAFSPLHATAPLEQK